MKEIGKLIELLNEYCMGAFVYDNDILRFRLGDRAKIEGNAILISKSFGFIKWLVENDKIDQKGIEYKFQDVLFELEEEEIVKEKSDFLIMLLSISDTPIEDLLLYLK